MNTITSPSQSLNTRRSSRTIASPRARRALALRGIKANKLQGRGPGGRILEADVLEHSVSASAASSHAPGGTFVSASVEYLRAEIDAANLVRLQAKFQKYAEKKGTPFSLGDIVLYAVNQSVHSHTEVATEGDGVAFYSPEAKVLPVLRESGHLGLMQLAQRRSELLQAASAEGAIQEIAAVALFDAGAGRTDEWTPSLSSHYSLALGVGSLKKRPFAAGDELAILPTLKLCLAYNSSKIERRAADAFLQQVILFLEEPESLIFS